MTSRREFVNVILALAAVPAFVSAQTCCAAAKPKATGAAVVESNAQKTKIKITCPKCGKVEEIEIDTPAADKPYAKEWVCPKCGCKVKVSVEAPKAE
jgi:predicted RNA-binding Zn-ribbon protein involved in translation (DUF1610 family)